MPRPERALDPEAGVLQRFAFDLRQLRKQAGNPGYRELAQRAHFSQTTLAEAARGDKLPSLPVTLAYVDACGGAAGDWETRWHAVAAELDPEYRPVTDDADPPYVGLSAFGPADADRFFGRERLVEELLDRLARRRFVVVFGASGAGKSSLLRAGLAPRLGDVVLFAPGARPFEECAIQLARLLGTSSGRLHEELTQDSRALHRIARQAPGELVLVVDQFEEVFTLCAEDKRARFIDALVTAASADNSTCRVVLGIRADFYAHSTRHADLVEAMRDAQVVVGPMTTDELRRAIVQPAVQGGHQVEGALLAALVADTGGQAGVLPLLSHALLETWHRRRGNTLTLSGFTAAGRIEGALAQTAESLYTALSPHQQELARNLFLRLIALGDGTEDTKRRIVRDELDTDDPDLAVVIERLAGARLLTLDRDTVEIAHEALIRGWPRLRAWLSEDRDGLRIHRQLIQATEAWESVGRDPGALYRGVRLESARDLAATRPTALAAREREFLDASFAAEADAQKVARRHTRRLRQLVALLTVLLIVAAAAIVNVVRAQNAATGQRNFLTAQKVAGEAIALRNEKPALAAQLSLAADRIAPTTETRNALLSTGAIQLAGQPGSVNAVGFNRDGRVLATAGVSRVVQLWDTADLRHPKELATFDSGQPGTILSVAFSPDREVLATGSADHTVRLWNVANPRAPRVLSDLASHTDVVYAVAYSPNGRLLATGSWDHTVRLWDVVDPRAPKLLSVLNGHTLNVKAVAFSADGKLLATGSDDLTVRLWDVTDPRNAQPVATLTGHSDFINTAAFSSAGHLLATGSDDRTVRLWDITDPRNPRTRESLGSHTDSVRSIVFSPDGRTLVSTGLDRTVRLWHVDQQATEFATLTGHTSSVLAVAFSPTGRGLATGSADRTGQLWDTDVERAVSQACDAGAPTITKAEWDQYFPGIDYQPPCA